MSLLERSCSPVFSRESQNRRWAPGRAQTTYRALPHLLPHIRGSPGQAV